MGQPKNTKPKGKRQTSAGGAHIRAPRGDPARPAAAVELLRQLGVLSGEDVEGLHGLARAVVKNNRGEDVGEVRAAFSLPAAG